MVNPSCFTPMIISTPWIFSENPKRKEEGETVYHSFGSFEARDKYMDIMIWRAPAFASSYKAVSFDLMEGGVITRYIYLSEEQPTCSHEDFLNRKEVYDFFPIAGNESKIKWLDFWPNIPDDYLYRDYGAGY